MASLTFQPIIVIMLGYPVSEKSTFSRELVRRASRWGQFWNRRWICVSQDEIGSSRECEITVESHLFEGGSVVVDRCNIDLAQRSILVRMGHEYHELIFSVFCDTPFHRCVSRVMQRSRFDHPTLHSDIEIMTIMRRFESSFSFPILGREGSEICYNVYPIPESFASTIHAILEHWHPT